MPYSNLLMIPVYSADHVEISVKTSIIAIIERFNDKNVGG